MKSHPTSEFDTRVHRIHDALDPYLESESWKSLVGTSHLIRNREDAREAYHRPHSTRTNVMASLGGQGLIFSDGELWKKHRRIAQPLFHEHVMDNYIPAMHTAINGFVERIEQFRLKGEAWDLAEETIRFTLRALYTGLFGVDIAADHECTQLIIPYMDTVGQITFSAMAKETNVSPQKVIELGATRRRIDNELDRIIEARSIAPPESGDLIDSFRKEVSDQALKEELRTFFLAGAETTSNVLTWMLILLEQHEEITEELTKEVDCLPTNRPTNLQDIAQLPKLRATIQEVMRLYPGVWVNARESTCDTELNGRAIGKGDWLLICSYYLHRNPNHWDDPHTFRPSRFLNNPKGPERYSYVPFGEGRHMCIGRHFSEIESMLAASEFLKRFRIERAERSPIDAFPGLTLKPSGKIPVYAHAR